MRTFFTGVLFGIVAIVWLAYAMTKETLIGSPRDIHVYANGGTIDAEKIANAVAANRRRR